MHLLKYRIQWVFLHLQNGVSMITILKHFYLMRKKLGISDHLPSSPLPTTSHTHTPSLLQTSITNHSSMFFLYIFFWTFLYFPYLTLISPWGWKYYSYFQKSSEKVQKDCVAVFRVAMFIKLWGWASPPVPKNPKSHLPVTAPCDSWAWDSWREGEDSVGVWQGQGSNLTRSDSDNLEHIHPSRYGWNFTKMILSSVTRKLR